MAVPTHDSQVGATSLAGDVVQLQAVRVVFAARNTDGIVGSKSVAGTAVSPFGLVVEWIHSWGVLSNENAVNGFKTVAARQSEPVEGVGVRLERMSHAADVGH